ncbi:hypothetical protein ACE1EB_004418 [Salmonella enterica]
MDNEHFYHGKPCKRCGNTLKYRRGRQCIACKNKKHDTKLNAAEKYHGGPCGKCGGTLRYKKGRACVACKQEKNKHGTGSYRARSAEIPKRKPGDQLCLSCGQTKNYFFLDYCRECVTAEKHREPEHKTTFTRCNNCGEWKPYSFKEHCRQCEAAEKRRRLYWDSQDKIKEIEQKQRRYNDPY